MSQQNIKKTVILVVCMIVLIILTSLIFTKSIECYQCHKKVTSYYKVSGYDYDLCKNCAAGYFGPYITSESSTKVNNSLRNVLIVIEIIGFAGAIIVVNKRTSKSEKDMPFSNDNNII